MSDSTNCLTLTCEYVFQIQQNCSILTYGFVFQIQLINETSGSILFQTHPYEVPLTPAENNSEVVSPFNGYSPSGNVTVSFL